MLKFRISFIAILLLTFLFMTSCVKTPTEFYVCDAGNPIFIGKYVASKELMDKSPVFYNEKDMAIFRNNKFWFVSMTDNIL